MSVKYFGRKTNYFGRPLWEIVMNLKNFGKGRLVARTIYEKYVPEREPSFFKILSVHPHIVEYPENFRGNIIVEKVFRGRRKPEPEDIGEEAFWPDFRLIHKDQEAELYDKLKAFEANPTPDVILPRTAPLPPIWKEILAREMKTSTDKVPEIPMFYSETDLDPFIGPSQRVAKEGESPSYQTGPGNFNPVHPEFYKDVLWSKEEAKEKYCSRKPELQFVYEDRKLTPIEIQKSKSS